MRNAALTLSGILMWSHSALARQVCAEFNDHPQFRSAYQELLTDGSVMFTDPQVLVREDEYMEISMAHSDSASIFCSAHGMRWSQTHSSISSHTKFVEIGFKRGSQELELRLVVSPRLVARIIICRSN